MEDGVYLDRLLPGQCATVRELSLREELMAKLLSMGMTAGTWVECVGVSPGGDPKAYLVRGAVLALRGEDCRGIQIG